MVCFQMRLVDEKLERVDKGEKTEPVKCRKLQVALPDANPQAFEMVLSYIYTDRIHPTKKGQWLRAAIFAMDYIMNSLNFSITF